MRHLRNLLGNPLIAIPLCAFLLRMVAVVWLHTYHMAESIPGPPMSVADPHFSFGNEIGSIAKALVTGHGYSTPFGAYAGPTAWIAPVYPLIAAGVFQLFGIFSDTSGFVLLAFNSLCAALTCIPIIKSAELMIPTDSRCGAWDGRRCGIVSAWIWALAPFFFRWTVTLVWEMSLCALLMSVALLWTLRLGESNSFRAWAGYGALWALMALTNPVMLSFLGAAMVWLAWVRLRPRSESVVMSSAPDEVGWAEKFAASRIHVVRTCGKKSCSLAKNLKLTTVMLLVFGAGISPWIVRNRIAFGQWVFLRSNFGFEFYLANGHTTLPFGWGGGHPSVNPYERADYVRLGELGYVASRKAKAMQFVHEYPSEFADRIATRVGGFWAGTPVSTYMKDNRWQPWFFAPLSLLSLVGTLFLCTRRVRGAGLFAGLMLLYPAPFYLAFPQERNRHPMEPLMLVATVFLLGVLYAEATRWISTKLGSRSELAMAEANGSAEVLG